MKKTNTNTNSVVKMDCDILHFLPFKPTIRRTRGFFVERRWGQTKMELTADWTLNSYDLISFAQVLNEYQKNKDKWETVGEMGSGKYKREVIKMELDIQKFVQYRNIDNVKKNRKSIFDSLERLFSIKLKYETDEKIIYTRYVYDIEIEKNEDYKKITTYVNKPFLEFCIKSGMLFNFGRLINYSKAYSCLLDSYIQGTKVKTDKGYTYKNIFKEEDLFEILYLNEVKDNNTNKHKKIADAFTELHQVGKLPLYVFDKIEKTWIKEDYLKFLNT
ncbi:MAG: hypothetical protein KGV43_01915 [Arcobacter sp.]|nr:hypothetical protein [Arcobacter sp.]